MVANFCLCERSSREICRIIVLKRIRWTGEITISSWVNVTRLKHHFIPLRVFLSLRLKTLFKSPLLSDTSMELPYTFIHTILNMVLLKWVTLSKRPVAARHKDNDKQERL